MLCAMFQNIAAKISISLFFLYSAMRCATFQNMGLEGKILVSFVFFIKLGGIA